MANLQFWLVRAGQKGEIAQDVVAHEVIAIGWPEIGDLSNAFNRDDVNRLFFEANPQASKYTAAFAVGQLFRFAHGMSQGDIVLVPLPESRYMLAEVAGSYSFNPDLISGFPHTRRVRWIGEPFAAIILSNIIRRTAASPRTVIELNGYGPELQRLAAQLREGTPVAYNITTGPVVERFNFEGFKAFKDRVEVQIEPITVIAGVNSGGKSSILQALLLARQSLITPYRSATENTIVLEGELVKFPDFYDMVFGKPPASSRRSFSLGFTINMPSRSIEEEAGDAYRLKLDVQIKYDSVRQQSFIQEAMLNIAPTESVTSSLTRITLRPDDNRWKVIVDARGEQRTLSTDLMSFDRFIPVWRDPSRRSQTRPPASGSELLILINFSTNNLLFVDDETLGRLFINVVAPAMDVLREWLINRVFYIGPLRSPPQRAYLRSNLDPLYLGPTGEYVVQQLADHWKDTTDFIELPDNLDEFHPSKAPIINVTLGHAVLDSLRLLSMEQLLSVRRKGEVYEAGLGLHRRPEVIAALDQVGFGIGQILPIIALSLLSPPDSLLIFEQPEIHLHPRAQAGLADLLLIMARLGRRFLIETHSDHLINRLRLRAAQDAENQLEGQVNILFVRPPDAERSSATVEQAHINRYGEIDNWPTGFLAQTAIDTRQLMLAGSNKRIREKQQKADRDNGKPGPGGER